MTTNTLEQFDIIAVEILLNEVGDKVSSAVFSQNEDQGTLVLYDGNSAVGSFVRPAALWRSLAWYNPPYDDRRIPYGNGETWLDIVGRIVRTYAGVPITTAA
jgi:hypothetical protein